MEVYFSTGFNAEVRQAEAVFSLLLLLTASPCSEKAFSSPYAAAPPLPPSSCMSTFPPQLLTVELFFSPFCLCLFIFASCRRRKAGILPSLEDLLFYTIAEGQEKIPAHKFTTVSYHSSDMSESWIFMVSEPFVK